MPKKHTMEKRVKLMMMATITSSNDHHPPHPPPRPLPCRRLPDAERDDVAVISTVYYINSNRVDIGLWVFKIVRYCVAKQAHNHNQLGPWKLADGQVKFA